MLRITEMKRKVNKMPSHIDRFTIEKFEDNTYRLYCERLNRDFYGIVDECELIFDLLRELRNSKNIQQRKH